MAYQSRPVMAPNGHTDSGVKLEQCGCYRCLKESGEMVGAFPIYATRMVVCRSCGNKRCPHSTDHRLTCTGSNEPDQPGSRYSDAYWTGSNPQPTKEPGQ